MIYIVLITVALLVQLFQTVLYSSKYWGKQQLVFLYSPGDNEMMLGAPRHEDKYFNDVLYVYLNNIEILNSRWNKKQTEDDMTDIFWSTFAGPMGVSKQNTEVKIENEDEHKNWQKWRDQLIELLRFDTGYESTLSTLFESFCSKLVSKLLNKLVGPKVADVITVMLNVRIIFKVANTWYPFSKNACTGRFYYVDLMVELRRVTFGVAVSPYKTYDTCEVTGSAPALMYQLQMAIQKLEQNFTDHCIRIGKEGPTVRLLRWQNGISSNASIWDIPCNI